MVKACTSTNRVIALSPYWLNSTGQLRRDTPRAEFGEDAMSRRPVELLIVTEEVTGDLVAWSLLLFGVVFGLGLLGAVEALAHFSGR
jgi:hypothetical protein